MQKLFVIYIGGSCPGALIELHDLRLVVARPLRDTYETLRKSWWGSPEGLHLDAWGILHWADGHRIEIIGSDATTNAASDLAKTHPTKTNSAKLYFVNLGGYDSKQFTELHRNIFVVAEDDRQAKLRALKHITNWQSPHRDYQFDVDSILNVSDFLPHKIRSHLVLRRSLLNLCVSTFQWGNWSSALLAATNEPDACPVS